MRARARACVCVCVGGSGGEFLKPIRKKHLKRIKIHACQGLQKTKADHHSFSDEPSAKNNNKVSKCNFVSKCLHANIDLHVIG